MLPLLNRKLVYQKLFSGLLFLSIFYSFELNYLSKRSLTRKIAEQNRLLEDAEYYLQSIENYYDRSAEKYTVSSTNLIIMTMICTVRGVKL